VLVLVSFCLQLNVTMYVFIVWLILLIIFCYQLYHDDGLKSETFNSVMYSRYVVGQYSIVMAVALVTALWWICYVHLVLQYSLHFSQLDLNLANLEATVEAEWILVFLLLQKRHFYWRHIVSCKYWWDILQFSVTQIVRIICAKNCEKLSKFIEVTTKILSHHFFLGHGLVRKSLAASKVEL